jgi:hypothetical protein
MRKDMAQLLVERPRLYRVETYKGHRRRLNRDPESVSTKQGMRRPYYERKHFNEYFAPVMGFLRKSVGRPWNKVFSELCESLSGGGTVIDHVKVHVLRDFVTLQPVWHNGVPCYPAHSYSGSRSEARPIERRMNGGFYVDQCGLLKQARVHQYKVAKPKILRLQIDDSTAYHKIDGHWFRVWTKALGEASAESAPLYDVLLQLWVRPRGDSRFYQPGLVWDWYVDGHSGFRELLAVHGSLRVAYRKEQISNRTIRRERLNQLIRE